MTYPYGKTVTLLTRTTAGEDGYGNDVVTFASTDISNVPVWPRTSTEITQGADQVISGLTALLPPGTDVSAVDQVQIDGAKYEIDGDPGSYVSPFTGLNPGLEINLKRVTG